MNQNLFEFVMIRSEYAYSKHIPNTSKEFVVVAANEDEAKATILAASKQLASAYTYIITLKSAKQVHYAPSNS